MRTAVNVTELDALIARAGKAGYAWHQFRRDRHGPDVLAGVYRWRECADVVVLTDDETSHAYRTPTDAAVDVFAPSHVHWVVRPEQGSRHGVGHAGTSHASAAAPARRLAAPRRRAALHRRTRRPRARTHTHVAGPVAAR